MGTHPSLDASLHPITLLVNKRTYHLHITDEYDDLRRGNPLLNFVLVFMEWSYLEDAKDFESWCKSHQLRTKNPELESYFNTISSQLVSICALFPHRRIDYFISDIDYQLSAGAVQELRKGQSS